MHAHSVNKMIQSSKIKSYELFYTDVDNLYQLQFNQKG